VVSRALLAAAALVAGGSLAWLGHAGAQSPADLPAPQGLRVVDEIPAPKVVSVDALGWERSSTRIDIGAWSLAWSDEFDSRRILAGDQSGSTLWYAGAQGGPYGVAAVGYSPRDDVYLVSNGILTIRAHAYTNPNGTRTGSWYSGHLQTVNVRGEGFAIQEGYFEARMKVPASMGAWPAFWLKPRSKWLDPAATNLELDVLEWYGGDWTRAHHTVHLGAGADRRYWEDASTIVDAQGRPVDLSQDWHTYGALLTPDWFIVYVDRMEVARFPLLEIYRQPFYPQLTLSIQRDPKTGVVSPQAVSPMDLLVDYVRVYTRRYAVPRPVPR
jgi:beta-glucanase (GH16 family)